VDLPQWFAAIKLMAGPALRSAQ
jgi:hypothetical protein